MSIETDTSFETPAGRKWLSIVIVYVGRIIG